MLRYSVVARHAKHKKGIDLTGKCYTRMQRTHIQLCVRDMSVIKNHEVYNEKLD